VDKRTLARELTIQALYQLDVQGEAVLDSIDEFFRCDPEDGSVRDEFARQLAGQWTRGVWLHLLECDALILGAAAKWRLPRLSPVDRSILRLSVYQLKFCPDIPPKAVINEAIELAKKYSTESAPSFVNGVLDAVLKKVEVKSS
jgi:transcription antitermination factor NusB